MKNRLVATLLMLTALSSFSSTFTQAIMMDQQGPSNAELLVHLKKYKAELIEKYGETLGEESILKKEFRGHSDYEIMADVWNEVYAHPLIQKDMSAAIDHDFNLICTNMKTFTEITDLSGINLIRMLPFVSLWTESLCNDDRTEIQSMFIKYHKDLVQSIFKKYYQDSIDSISGTLDAFGIAVGTKNLGNGLLKKIDAKIAELKAQA